MTMPPHPNPADIAEGIAFAQEALRDCLPEYVERNRALYERMGAEAAMMKRIDAEWREAVQANSKTRRAA